MSQLDSKQQGNPYAEYQREYFKNHREQYRESNRKYRSTHRKQLNLVQREYKKQKRMELIELLGGKCSNPKCAVPGGMKDPRALQIDHVNGEGAKQRRDLKDLNSMYRLMLREIKAGSKDYQLLCANCNWIKRHERNELC